MIYVYIWLAGHVIIPPVLYLGYCAVSAMIYAKRRKPEDGQSQPHVIKVDTAFAVPIILLDGLYNAVWLPFLCLDPRPHYAFRMVTVKGVTFPFFELATERFSRYNEQPGAWRWHKFIVEKVRPFLDGKDYKGWHIRKFNAQDAGK